MRARRAGFGTFMVILTILGTLVLASCGAAESPGGTGDGPGRAEIVVSAAADLAPVLAELGPSFEAATGIGLSTNIGSTGLLRQQIESGARVDVFVAASKDAIDQLSEKKLLVPGTEQVYARGRLVIWVRPGSALTPPKTLEELTSASISKISIANPDHAPYGQAAREALQSAGLWDELQPKLVPAENALQAFQYAQTGNVDVGLVPLSLVATGDGAYQLVPETMHAPISQALAVIASSPRQTEARRFVEFLTGPVGGAVLEKYGFVVAGT